MSGGVSWILHHHIVRWIEAQNALTVWSQLLQSTPFQLSMHSPIMLNVPATADAMASTNLAGCGGAAFFPDGTVIFFQFQLTLQEAQAVWPWIGDDMQKHIASWELLAQYALTFCINTHLPTSRRAVTCPQVTNSEVGGRSGRD